MELIIWIKKSYDGLNISEFGNQWLWLNNKIIQNDILKINLYNKYNYYSKNKVVYTSIDYNGDDRDLKFDFRDNGALKFDFRDNEALKFDFRDDLPQILNNEYNDEHLILNQYKVFKNFHDLGNENCIYYHVLPLTKNWHKHGTCDYILEFFNILIQNVNTK